ncbi:PQQ-binding-like beta-propeller repeat protein [Hylemonella gracilis]|nr:PQQ-binding-like beta-propeller repeat protein [Hylemonella gracilis]
MSAACSISDSVLYQGEDTLCLTPTMPLPLPAMLPAAMQVVYIALVPAAPVGAVSIWITDNGVEIPGTRLSSSGASQPAWVTVPAFSLSAGSHNLAWISNGSGGSWPAGVVPFYIGQVQFGGDTINLKLWCGEQGGANAISCAVEAANDPAPLTYFTSFEDTCGILYFLRCIPWLDWSSMDLFTYVEQSNTRAANGIYSALFVQRPPFGAPTLWSRELPVPPTAKNITVTFACYMGRSDGKIGYKVFFDGNMVADKIGTPPFSGAWCRIIINEPVTFGAQKCKFEITLEPLPNIPLDNDMYMDDLAVDFGKPTPLAARAIVYGDIRGNVYGVSNQTGAQLWTAKLPHGYVSATPAIVNGTVYLSGNGNPGLVQARNGQTGTQIWSTDIPAAVDVSPCVVGSIVYVVAENGVLYGLNKLTGALASSQTVFSPPAGSTTVFALQVINNVAYVATAQGVYAYDMTVARQKWFHQTSASIKFAPTIWQNFIYFGRTDGVFEALHVDTGQAIFPAQSFGLPIYTTPQIVGGLVVFGTDSGQLVALNATTGARVWTIAKSGMIRGFLVSNDRVYLVANGLQGTFYAIQFQIDSQGNWTFTSAWSTPVAGGIQQAPLIDDELIVFTGGDSKLYALESKNGTALWSYAGLSVAFMSPVLNKAPAVQNLQRRYDQCCFLCAHNAYATSADGWLYAQQSYNLTDQLNAGVRAMMLDVGITQCAWQWLDEAPWVVRQCGPTITAAQDIYFIHENLDRTALALFPGGFTALRTFANGLDEIRQWLVANPNEVVTLFLESQVNNATLMQQSLKAGGVWDMIFWADRPNTGPNGTWNVANQGWPTLEWMVNAGKRLVVLSQHRVVGDGIPDLYAYAVENQFGNQGIDAGCNPRRESRPLNDTTRALFIMNYFVDWSVSHAIWYPFHYSTQNDYYSITSKVSECSQFANRLPNFIAVDYFQRGNNGGPLAAVAYVDGQWQAHAAAKVWQARDAQ